MIRRAEFGQLDGFNSKKYIPIDEDVLISLSEYQHSFINLLGNIQDATGYNYSYSQRVNYYHDVLMYWNTMIHNLKAEVVVFWVWPHTPAYYALYILAKVHHKMNVLFINPVPLFNMRYHFVSTSLRDHARSIVNLYESDKELTASQDLIDHLDAVKNNVYIKPEYIKVNQNDEVETSLKSHIFLFFRSIAVSIYYMIRADNKLWRVDVKINKEPYDSPKSRPGPIRHYIYIRSILIRNYMLRRVYNRYISNVDLKEKYIYFAAPYQPEAVTSVAAGYYDDVLLAISILSSAMPTDWVVYYKEHPGTFKMNIWRKSSIKRNRWFYSKIDSFDNVKIISHDIETSMLIDNSQAVSTVAGTVGWESIVRSKCAIVFGNAWYSGCKSVFSVSSAKDVSEAIQEIIRGCSVDYADVVRFAAAIEEYSIKGLVHHNFNVEFEKIENKEEHLEQVADAIYDEFMRTYG